MNTPRADSSRALSTRPPARPTSRAATSASVPNANHIIAIYESRGIGREVGIACLDKDTGRATMLQLSDCQTYVKTLGHIYINYPSIILVLDSTLPANPSSTHQLSPLVKYIQEEFADVSVEPVARKYWNEATGSEVLAQLILDDEERAPTLLALANNSFALCSAAALFKYLQAKMNLVFAPKSLSIRWTNVQGTMLIDRDTARNLELGGNTANKKSNHSLFGLLNHTFTVMGMRLLRVNILAPMTVYSGIEARLDAVDELVKFEDVYTAVKTSLRTMNKVDIDKLISSIVSINPNPHITSPREASYHVTTMLQLRNVIRSIPTIAQSVSGCQSFLLRTIGKLLIDERLDKIEVLLSRSLNDDAGTGKKTTGLPAANYKIYAIRSDFSRLLDIARETYKENVNDIMELSQTLSQEHNLGSLALVYQERGGGFWFTVPKVEVEGELPRGFVNVTAKGAKWMFSSLELKKRNARMKDSLEEALVMSDKIIQELVEEVVENISALYKASEAVSMLDLLWSFAHVTILHSYVRPEFTGTFAIKAGRHPVLENIQSVGSFVANDTYASETSTFQIVQGPNMSGKSTYLRQLGLLTVMAMCGCFVPAEYASFKLHDALLTRLSNDDDPEKSLSTFANEMAGSAMILSLTTKDSLVLIDELGRGTSTIEGVGIAHAIAEKLVGLKAFTFFATHFSDLTTTLSRRQNVVNLHLAVQNNTRASSGQFGLKFQYRLTDGRADEIPHYGLELARLANLPPSILSHASKVAHQLTKLDETKRKASQTTLAMARRKAILRLHTQLKQAHSHSTLPDPEMASYLRVLQKEIVDSLGSVLEA